MLRTPICDLLGIEKPVFQGGMAWIADATRYLRVEAGGLGVIAAMIANADWLREQIHELREKTDKPFGVNVMLMSPFADEVAQVVIDEHVPVVITGAGNPTKYMKAWNARGHQGHPRGRLRLPWQGSFSGPVPWPVVAGGHRVRRPHRRDHHDALVPQVVDAVKIPVIAAGGIADGRGFAAALMLGAVGVQVGTRFLVANECTVSDQYKDMVIKANDISTRATGRSTGHPVRALKNPFSNKYAQMESAGASEEELNALGTGALRKAAKEGDYENGSFLCGQIAGMVRERQSALEIVDDLVNGAEKVLSGAMQWVR